jgi:hypothetical protein
MRNRTTGVYKQVKQLPTISLKKMKWNGTLLSRFSRWIVRENNESVQGKSRKKYIKTHFLCRTLLCMTCQIRKGLEPHYWAFEKVCIFLDLLMHSRGEVSILTKKFNTRPVVPGSVHFNPVCSLHSPLQWYEHQDCWKIQPGFDNFWEFWNVIIP